LSRIVDKQLIRNFTMKISDITVEDSENRKKRSLNIEDVYVTPQKNVSETFNEKAIDNFNDSFYLDSESLEYYDDEQMNEQMKKYLDNVDYDTPDFLPAKKPMFVREGISKNNYLCRSIKVEPGYYSRKTGKIYKISYCDRFN